MWDQRRRSFHHETRLSPESLQCGRLDEFAGLRVQFAPGGGVDDVGGRDGDWIFDDDAAQLPMPVRVPLSARVQNLHENYQSLVRLRMNLSLELGYSIVDDWICIHIVGR